ncbi:MAG: hypothetical protein CVU64_02460 [Deltaproteobacteria bacterium HGW-Deltaproteobacteria-21]|nr:MAG: hypothetical protein CVU64_02460 [Deltaproteobacteria bacterium HGW-Deltaproteobacteria-21]
MPDSDNGVIIQIMVGQGLAESLLKSFPFVWITVQENIAECMELHIRAGVEQSEEEAIQSLGLAFNDTQFRSWE